jgi:hypothetical protein
VRVYQLLLPVEYGMLDRGVGRGRGMLSRS